MNVTELKSDLHEMIENISDTNVLIAVKTLLSGKADSKTDWWDVISEEERAEIEQGLDEDNRGEVLSHEKVMEKYKKWL